MSLPLEIFLFVLLLACAVVAVVARSMIATVAVLSAFSLVVALLFAGLGAPDVAFVEAVLGSAVVGVLLLLALRRTGDRPAGRDMRAALVAAPLALAFGGLLIWASSDLSPIGEPADGRVSEDYVARSLADSETPNVVTAVLADYRSLDTLGETLVVFTAAMAVAVILGRGARR